MIQNIPFELQRLNQWVVASGAIGADGKPNKEPLNPRTGFRASVTDPTTWGSFAEAMRCNMKFVGFVLSKDDPYCIIDLDNPKDESQVKRHVKIAQAFESYTEFSQSGKGLHIIMRGKVPHGVRRDNVEVYSSERYMICTGNVYRDLPILDFQPLLDQLYAEMNHAETVELVQHDGPLTDDQVWEMATTATNAIKFLDLWEGNWQGNPLYPSQSEADFALMAIIAFYTKDNEQARRLFRLSALGKRDKATKNNKYLNYALAKIRAKEPAPIDLSALISSADRAPAPETRSEQAEPERPTNAQPAVQVVQQSAESGEERETANEDKPALQNGTRFPPGFLGECAEYITSSSVRPVREIGLAAAIALTAGVCGRSYNISGIGLNQYIILLAKTGSGKEGVARGIDNMVTAVRQQVPSADRFIGPGTFASGQALIRVLDDRPCFVSVLGEFGLTLQQLCDPQANASQLVLKRVLLDLYGKSGFNSVLRSSVYSDIEKNTKMIKAPNVTIIGESTPDTFFSGLDQSHIAEGLIPRFTIFEYSGQRPPRNPTPSQPPGNDLTNRFAELVAIALTTEQNNTFCPVQVDAHAGRLLDEFDAYCDAEINKANADVTLQLWNRAHLKAIKLAALVAVGCNANQPIVDAACADWAIELACADIRRILAKFTAGEIGVGSLRQEHDVRNAVQDYLLMNKKARRSYGIVDQLLDVPLVPFAFLRRRLQVLASFKNDKRGTRQAIDSTLDDLVKADVLVLVPPLQARSNYNVTSPVYALGKNWAVR